MGRREKQLDPDAGPVERFAHGLRRLREEAGSPAYRDLSAAAGFSAPTLSEAAAGRRLPSLRVTLAYVRSCGGDEDEWEERWREAEDAVGQRPRDDDGPAPYPGLARYGTRERDLFFGREELVGELLRMTRRHRVVTLVGPSGSGKSSLLCAGLIPALCTAPGDLPPAAVRVCTPGTAPARTLHSVLAPGERVAGPMLLVIDQFEELFTLCEDPAQRTEFVTVLRGACRPHDGLRVVLAVRADFFGHCADIRELAGVVNDAHLLIPPMSRAQLREAIVKPAAAVGAVVERAVTERMVEDVADQPGGLPLMSHALLELWRRRRGKTLTMSAYESIGGVQGAIAHTAEEVISRLGPEQAQVARATLLRLVTPGANRPDTRRPVPRAELAATGTQAEVLERLVAARLLTVDDDTVELAHEALITAWPRLWEWVDGQRARLRLHRALTQSALRWEEVAHDPGALLRGTLLTEARAEFVDADGTVAAELNDLEAKFLNAAVEESAREAFESARAARNTRLLTVLLYAVPLVSLLVWTVWFLNREHP